MGKSTECCNQDCSQWRTCPQRNAATGVTLAADRVGTVYVSGPMTGYEDWNFPAFNAAADALRSQGYKVINPADHGVVPGAEWEDYLRKDVADLAACEAIHLLPGWSQSKGARLELYLAKALGLRVMYAESAEHADAAAVDHHPLHQHLLHMLGAKDHVDAGRIIAQHHLRELAVQQGVPSDAEIDRAIEGFDWEGWIDQEKALRTFVKECFQRFGHTHQTQKGLDAEAIGRKSMTEFLSAKTKQEAAA